MNKLLNLIFISLFVSCANSNSKNNKEEDSHHQNETIIEEVKEVDQKTKEEINIDLKNALRGIWASNEYKESLLESNSITVAENAIEFYTDIVFDGNEILHCNKPFFMEEHYLYLKPDSTIVDDEEKLIFSIASIKNQIMEIKDSNNNVHSYTRVIENANLESIFMEVTKGTNAIEKEWIANNYDIKLDTLEFKAELLKNGEIKSDLKFTWISPFSYLDKDIIEFRFENDSTLLYSIKEYSDTLITLEGIENITEMDAPIVPNGKIGYMKKI